MKKAFIVIFILLGLTLVSFFANAQQTGLGIEEQVSIGAIPQNPRPGQSVTVTVDAYGTDLNSSTITWSVNGKVIEKGVGKKSFTTTIGANGAYLTVVASIVTSAGSNIQKTITVSSQEVDLLWEGTGYTPPFYKSKTFYIQEGSAKLLAVPNMYSKTGVKLDPSKLVYTWKVNDTVLGSLSGYGKNSLVYEGTILLKDTKIEVVVSSVDGTTGSGLIILTPQSPLVLMYENSPLYGILSNKAVAGNFLMKNKEINVVAYPYHFSVASRVDPKLTYSWSINNSNISTPASQNYAVFRNSSNQRGTSLVSVSLTNGSKLFQRGSTGASITF